MDGLYLLALAVGLGLLGFVEPCSIGTNMVFLGHLREKGRGDRLWETAKFALVRSMVLGLFGLGIAILGGSVFAAQKGFWLLLGLLYLALGVARHPERPVPLGAVRAHLRGPVATRAQKALFGVGAAIRLQPPRVRLPVDAGPPGTRRRVRSPVGLRHAVRLRARAVFTPRSPGLLSLRFNRRGFCDGLYLHHKTPHDQRFRRLIRNPLEQ